MRNLIFFSLLSIFLFSCTKKKEKEQLAEDDKIIQAYLIEKGITATKTSSGLYYWIENPGTGASCSSSSDVRVAYRGYFTDGEVFDQSEVEGITFNLAQVIEGWTEGIPFFKEGGNGKLFIPSKLGYGKSGNSSIPENSVLVFDVNLIEVL